MRAKVKATLQSPPNYYNSVIANPVLLAIAAVAVAFLVTQITAKGEGVDVCSLISNKVSLASRVAYSGKLPNSSICTKGKSFMPNTF